MATPDDNPLDHLLDSLNSKAFVNDLTRRLRSRVEGRNGRQADQDSASHEDWCVREDESRESLRLSLEKHVFPMLTPPFQITLDEILEVGHYQLTGLQITRNQEDLARFSDGFERFVCFVDDLISDENEGDEIDLGVWKQESDKLNYWLGEQLWSPHEDSWLWVRFRVPEADFEQQDGTQVVRAVACWQGTWSEKALDAATEPLLLAAPSITRSIQLVHGSNSEALFSDSGRRLFAACAEASAPCPMVKGGSLKQRMKNAVQLLREADLQGNYAVALALSFSAIEALLCRNKTGIIDELSRNAATLLQPNPLERADSIQLVRWLYDCRSRALHGESLKVDAEQASRVRALGAAVLHAVVEWEDFQNRSGGNVERKELLKELHSAQIAGQQVVGVPEGLARFVIEGSR